MIDKRQGKKMTKKNNASFMKPMTVSSELSEVIRTGPMPRTQVTKKLWDYIKKHKRQDPENKRNIIPDEKLAKVFGSKNAINMFEMTKKVNQHLS